MDSNPQLAAVSQLLSLPVPAFARRNFYIRQNVVTACCVITVTNMIPVFILFNFTSAFQKFCMKVNGYVIIQTASAFTVQYIHCIGGILTR